MPSRCAAGPASGPAANRRRSSLSTGSTWPTRVGVAAALVGHVKGVVAVDADVGSPITRRYGGESFRNF
jgi:hypothetical protein